MSTCGPADEGLAGVPQVQVCDNAATVGEVAAELFAANAARSVGAGSRFVALLSGGATPLGMFRVLADSYQEVIPWDKVFLFWGDERFVPFDHPESNFGAAKRALVDRVAIPDENVFPIPVHLPTPGDAADAYEVTIRAFFNDAMPEFDIALLGLGEDGHTASIFPSTAAVTEERRLVTAGEAPVAPAERVTVTYPVLNGARACVFLVSGRSKVAPVRQILEEGVVSQNLPASLVRGAGQVYWVLDRKALGAYVPQVSRAWAGKTKLP